jgi:ribokinase
MSATKILVVGGASLDTLQGVSHRVPGGGGMYTAMAAARSGATVTLYAPLPTPMPAPLAPVAARLTWIGPTIPADQLAHFEIHYEQERAIYVVAEFGSEDTLSMAELPADLGDFDAVHIITLGDVRQQLAVLRVCRERGARTISAGSALDLINACPEAANDVVDEADILFMNEAEAMRLFGSMPAVQSRADQLIYVTQGRKGATVVQGTAHTFLQTSQAVVVDPTGAGDTFCGATLHGITVGRHPVEAARHAMPLAADMIGAIGPASLLPELPPPLPASDTRVTINARQVAKVAALIAASGQAESYPFVDDDLPAPGHPATLDYFFTSVLQQFGFWSHARGRYREPLVATVDGELRKGAFYLFRAWRRWLHDDPERLTPRAQANLSKADLLAVLRDDAGDDPVPAIDLHLAMARAYGKDMLALQQTPADILRTANQAAAPMSALLNELDRIGGYKEDPLRKKSALLAIILRQRPEIFLLDKGDDAPPIVDYHVMRSCLRIGLLDVVDEQLAAKLTQRRLLNTAEEWAVRSAAFACVDLLVQQSGKSLGAVDWFLFQARQRCPEMQEPECAACELDSICAHRKAMFQPVIRTSFY